MMFKILLLILICSLEEFLMAVDIASWPVYNK